MTTSRSIRELVLCQVNLSRVCPSLLGQVVTKLTHFNLQETNLTTSQSNIILCQSLTAPRLISLNLRGVKLTSVHPALLAAAVCHTRQVN